MRFQQRLQWLMAGYAYTLQTVPYEVSAQEQRQAQLMMWKQTNVIKPRVWIILAVLTTVALAGIIFVQHYSTVIFWLILIGILIFLAIRLYGLEWYAKRKMAEFPIQDIKGIKLGVQPYGMVMQQSMGTQVGTATISWKEITEWYDQSQFILITFNSKGQQGSFFLPKRMDSRNFPFETIRKHLNETVGLPKALT